jgi:hypothetical protein
VFDHEEVAMHLSPAIHRLFTTQHGVASVDQLVAAGCTRRQLKRLEAAGAIVAGLRRTYRSPSVPFDELARCASVCLANPELTISGPTAGRLWGFRRLPADRRIHVIAPPASNPAIAEWVVPYRTAAIHDHDIVERGDGIRVTSRARTAFDLTRWLANDDLLSVIEQALHDGGLAEQHMWETAADWLTPGRPWARRFVRQLDRRLPGGAAESHPEVKVASALSQRGVRGLQRQWSIHLPGYGPARFDLAVPELCWAIEVDVHPTHRQTLGATSDHRRDLAARSIGWFVTRIGAERYELHFDSTLDALVDEYQRRLRSASA